MYKTILHNRSLQVLGIAESVSGIGNWITMLAVFAMIVFDGGGTEAQSSAVFLAGLLPTLVFSPVAGWLCDRLDRKWLMIGSELASGMVVAGIIFARRLELNYFLFLLTFLAVFVFIGCDVLSSIFVRDVLHREAGFYGTAIGFVGLGTVAGTVFLMAQKGEGRQWGDVVAGLALLGTVPAFLAPVAWLDRPGVGGVIVLTTCLFGGVGNGFINVQASTLLHLLSPPEILGRIGGAFQSTLVTGQLAELLIVPALVPTLVSMGAYFTLSAAIVVALVAYATIALSGR